MINVPCKRKSGMLDQLITNKDNFILITCRKYWPKIRKNKQEPNHKFKRQVKNESHKRCYGYNGKKDHINWEGWLIFKYNKLISLSNHINTISKKHGSPCVLTKEEDVGVIGCILGVQECGLSTTLQQLKTKVAKLN